MSSPGAYVDLGRQFGELADGAESENAALNSYIGQYLGGTRDTGWEWIYREDCSSVVLGEPGSGKSMELQYQARAFQAAGKPALYLNLRALVSGDDPYLDNADALIRRWRKSKETAWFFLDSVDESKLEHIDDFHIAIRRIAKWVGQDASRARYVISSRISEWRAITDRRLVEESLLIPARASDGPTPEDNARRLKVVTLLPLTNDQARQFQGARNGGVVDERFFGAVDQAHAWDFMRRPLDVVDLYSLWQTYGRLGRLGEVVESAVNRLLAEDRNKSSLPMAKARDGAELVAACLAFHKRVALALKESVPTDGSALPLRECLPDDWTAEDAAQLIQMPLFDAAAYGKVRFHHRTYQDYLAANWLARQMQADLPLSELTHLLFAQNAKGEIALRPSLAPVAAWLACLDASGARWQDVHRQALLSAAPWIFFSQGDPQSLPVDYRANVLHQTVERYRGRDHVHIDRDNPTLRRFADPALADVASAWISDKTVSADIRADYVALVLHGSLLDALPSVIAMAIDVSEHEYLRATALICVARIGQYVHKARVVKALAGSEPIPLRVGVHIVQIAYPAVIDEPALPALLHRIEVGVMKSRPSTLYMLDQYIERETPIERVPLLIETLLGYICDESGGLRRDRGWVADWLGPLLARLFGTPRIGRGTFVTVFRALDLLGTATEAGALDSYSDKRDFENIQEASRRHPELRREWYWWQVDKFRRTKGREPTMLFELDMYYVPLKSVEEDEKWWRADVRQRANSLDRAFALRVVLATVSNGARRPLLPPWDLVRLGMREDVLRHQLADYVRWGLTSPFYRLRSKWKYEWSRGYGWQRRKRQFVDRYWVMRNRVLFFRKRAELRSGDWWPGIRFIIDNADRSGNRWGSHEFAEMTKRYGEGTVSAALEGAGVIWRKHQAPLPHQKRERNQTPTLTVAGLTALEYAWDRHGQPYFESLSVADAVTATRYALDELNGFPPWFPTLARSHLDAVREPIAEALRGEWATIAEDAQVGSPTLQRLVYGGDLPESLYAPVLKDLLTNSLPHSPLVLTDSLRLILRIPGESRDWLVPRAVAILTNSNDLDNATWPWLLTMWLVNADRAFFLLQDRFKRLEDSEQDNLCQTLCASLYGESRNGLSCPQPDFERPEFLRGFIPWVYKHVRPADDVVHDGVFSPGQRDHAERFRDSLLGRLENRAGQEADDALIALTTAPELAPIKDFILMRIENRKALKADEFLILPADIKALRETRERIPRSRADLFHTAWLRLRAFKESVESAEISIRGECNREWDEGQYQDWVQRHMQAVANGKYTIPCEAKVDPGKFPDLRFESPSVDGAISVEVKVATFSHWSYTLLERCLRDQLVGQYLRAANAKHGVFLLFRADRERIWRMADGTELDWSGLIGRLSSIASAIVDARPDIERLEVMGVDVT